ncbi:MAG: xylulokinase [Bryobacteraceae bacterium]
MWMGIDVGTGGTRALILDEAGTLAGTFTAPHQEMRMERPLWAEQSPEDWWSAAQIAIRGALSHAALQGSQIRAIGLSGQMHGLVVLDAENCVLRPSLIWCDQRSQAQVDFINGKVGRERVLAWTANPVLTGFTLPKLLWVRDREPRIFERVRHMLLPKDYVRFQLTGEYATDVSDASGTALFDVVNRRWSFDMADALGIDRSMLPAVYESSAVSGCVSRAAAAATGLAEGTPVVGGAGDQAASAVGNGIVASGVVSCTLGTSGVVFAHMDEVAYDPGGRVHTFCHAVKDKWHVMGVTQGAGLSLQWFRNRLAPGADYDRLTEEAETAPLGAQGLFWLPYLMGERTPHLDAAARGGWIGLTARHVRADLIRAILEGVCYSQKDCLEIIEGLNVRVDSVRASGGAARSPFWLRLLADVLGKPVVTLASQEGSAYGAALLAMIGSGQFASAEEACLVSLQADNTIPPRPDAVAAYGRSYATYRALYPALRPLFQDQEERL